VVVKAYDRIIQHGLWFVSVSYLYEYMRGFFRKDTYVKLMCVRYFCTLACVRCHVLITKNPTQNAKCPRLAIWWDESIKLTPCSLSGSWASCYFRRNHSLSPKGDNCCRYCILATRPRHKAHR